MAVFFTADEHYGHQNIIQFCNRPFANLDEMRETLISNHNAIVKPGDLVYHLGDMFWRTLTLEGALAIMDRLNGVHYYVSGNHEELMEKHEELRKRFVWVRERHKLKIKNMPHIVLDHFAGRVWDGSHNGSWQLYGHSHGGLREDDSLSFDVGVDAQKYFPIMLEQVTVRMFVKTGIRSFKQVAKEHEAQIMVQQACVEIAKELTDGGNT